MTRYRSKVFMISISPILASGLTTRPFLATANTEAVSMIAIEMAIRVRVRFLKVYTSFVVYINPLEIRGRVNTHRISERSLLCSC
jgi:hypothetical protein